MMFYDFMRKLTAEQSHDNLLEAFGDQAPSKRTVERWYLEFKRDRTPLQDEPRSGRPSTAVTPYNVATVESLIREDSRITFEQIAEILYIGKGAINTMLHDNLGVSKIAARWIPHNLSKLLMEARVEWCKFMLKNFDGGVSKRVYDILTWTRHGSISMIPKQSGNLQYGCLQEKIIH